MNLKLSIFNALSRRAIGLIFVLFMSISFSPGGALADNCQGGADCLVCAELPHRHIPGAGAGMEDPDCRSTGQNSSCGFEANQSPDEFEGIVSSVRSYQYAYAGIFSAISDECGQTHLTGEFVPQFLLSDPGGAAPIYLLNQTLLC